MGYRESGLSLRDMKGECCWIKGLGDEGLNFMLSRPGDEVRNVTAGGRSRLDSFLLMEESEFRLLEVLCGKRLVLMISVPFLFALYKLLLPLLLLWALRPELCAVVLCETGVASDKRELNSRDSSSAVAKDAFNSSLMD